ncbi:MAG: ATPase, T2SS/T4P/T4SS family [Patescibacteria group bacterium]|nr:ATPase, T2SS/T4P/T4SS family [Patescibacteria group bacterium]
MNHDIGQAVEDMLKDSIAQQASDIHIEPRKGSLHIRLRIDGSFVQYKDIPLEHSLSFTTKIKLLGGMKIDETRLPQDGRYSIALDDNNQVEFRISSIPTTYGETIVLRILSSSGGNLKVDKLGFLEYHQEIIENISKLNYGIILTAGPTGSGKTTTLYSILNQFDPEEKNITTLEDPVEYKIQGINQTQINPEIGLTFGQGLRTLVRQDPDIIMVGEIRDKETAALATEAALTGHVVLSTIHTNSATATAQRLLNMGIESYLIGASLRIVISQRLLKKNCPHCIQTEEIPDHLKEKALTAVEDIVDIDPENTQFKK